jgi:pyridoxamine 5'-phosphate oxidase family protein
MATFSERQRAFLKEQRLGRLATVDDQGRPHVVPVGFWVEPDGAAIGVGGHDLAATKKFRDARRHPDVAIVIDDLVSVSPWRIRGIEVRGTAEARDDGAERLAPGFGAAWLRITPQRIIAWGLESQDGDA